MQSKKVLISIIAALSIAAIAIGVVSCGLFKKDEHKKLNIKKVEAEPIENPLSGDLKFRPEALKQRVIGIVVENHPDARPQVGMDDKKYSPDIIVEGEVEGGISRMLWLYADYKRLPKNIGPLRSARPPFIRFSKMFDAIFIHWGESHTEGGYIGANTVFKKEHVPHINAMNFPDKSKAFGRDLSTGKSLEHTGRAYGKRIPKALKEKKCRITAKPYTKLKFRAKSGPMAERTCAKLKATFSKVSGSTEWKYNEKTQKYTTKSFENKTKRDNLIVLFDKTKYITNAVYQGHGVTYCDYKFAGGKGYIASKGTIQKIKWKKKGWKLFLYTEEKKLIKKEEPKETEESAKDEMEEEPEYEIIEHEVELNRGKSWIGWVSSNNGGKIKITEMKKDTEEDKEKKEQA